MEDAADLISAIASFVWPLVALGVVWRVLPILRSRLAADDVTVKMMGFEFSLQDASENVAKQLADLQDRVAELAQRGSPGLKPDNRERRSSSQHAILWVDDHPTNNGFEVARLRSEGVDVETVLSTDEALAVLSHAVFDVVVTDMERTESGRTEPRAGIRLIERMRENGIATPVVVYCSPVGLARYGAEAAQHGALLVTSSPTELLETLRPVLAASNGRA